MQFFDNLLSVLRQSDARTLDRLDQAVAESNHTADVLAALRERVDRQRAERQAQAVAQ